MHCLDGLSVLLHVEDPEECLDLLKCMPMTPCVMLVTCWGGYIRFEPLPYCFELTGLLGQ